MDFSLLRIVFARTLLVIVVVLFFVSLPVGFAVTLTPIYDIQGSGSTSPVVGTNVTTTGIVTGIKSGSAGGFFIQDPFGDGNQNTSDGIFVFTGATLPAGAVLGNSVQVNGNVQEFIPAADPNQNPVTQLSGTITVLVLSTGNSLPFPAFLSAGDTTAASGIPGHPLDTLEEFEGMRVTVSSLDLAISHWEQPISRDARK